MIPTKLDTGTINGEKIKSVAFLPNQHNRVTEDYKLITYSRRNGFSFHRLFENSKLPKKIADCSRLAASAYSCDRDYIQLTNDLHRAWYIPFPDKGTLQDHILWEARIQAAVFSIDASASDARMPCTFFEVNKYLTTMDATVVG